jgi:hypothetical protein
MAAAAIALWPPLTAELFVAFKPPTNKQQPTMSARLSATPLSMKSTVFRLLELIIASREWSAFGNNDCRELP